MLRRLAAGSVWCSLSVLASGDPLDFIQVGVRNATTPPSEQLYSQLQGNCLKKFAKSLHALGVEVLADTKYLDDKDLQDVGLQLVHRRKVRASGRASEDDPSSTSKSSSSQPGVCTDGDVDEETIETSLEKELKPLGLDGFAQAFHELGVHMASDTAVLSDTELETVGLQLVGIRRLRDTAPISSRLPTRDPAGQPSLTELGLGDLGKKLVTLGVRNLQDIEYLDDNEMAEQGLLLVHRRKVRAASATSLAKQKAASADSAASFMQMLGVSVRKERTAVERKDTNKPTSQLRSASERFLGGDLDEHELLALLRQWRQERSGPVAAGAVA